MKERHTVIGLFSAAVGCLVAVQVFVSLPGDRWYWRDIQNLGHVPLYGLIAAVLWLLTRRLPSLAGRLTVQLKAAGLAALAIGIAAEGIQALGLGDADIVDVLRDLAGIVPTLMLVQLWLSRGHLSSPDKLKRAGLAVAVAALSLIPVGYSYYCYEIARPALFPVLVDFSAGWQERIVKPDDAEMEIVPPPPAWGLDTTDRVGEFIFSDTGYPGMAVEEPYPDWSGRSLLHLSLFNPGESMQVTLRVEDRSHDGEYTDRYNRTWTIGHGRSVITAPIEDIKNAPSGRKLDISDIQQLMLFSRPGPSRLYVDKVWLE